MTGLEPRTSGIGSDSFANWAKTTAQLTKNLLGQGERTVPYILIQLGRESSKFQRS